MKKIISYVVLFLAVISTFAPDLYASKYFPLLRKYTKSASMYDPETMDAKIIWHATLFMPKLRTAFSEKHVKINHMEPIEASQYIADEQMKQADAWQFIVSIYTKKDYKRLTMDEDSFWKLKLITANGEYAPLTIEKLPKTPYYAVMFSYNNRAFNYNNRWSDLYKITFPKTELGKKPELKIYSIVGDSTLKWTLRD